MLQIAALPNRDTALSCARSVLIVSRAAVLKRGDALHVN